jgi:hypothetical protein
MNTPPIEVASAIQPVWRKNVKRRDVLLMAW